MKVLIFGKNGQVAWELQRSCAVFGVPIVVGSDLVDFKKPDDVVRIIREARPTHIVNCAAYTAVDKAESEQDTVNLVNGYAVGAIAEEAKKISAHLVHYSTDYVFDGTKDAPYVETDLPNPINAYGRSKLLGEKYIQDVDGSYNILRVSWVYGNRGANFYKTMIRLGMEREELKIVGDQIGAPTWSRHIADSTAHLIRESLKSELKGIYHLSPQGKASWSDFAVKIFELYQERKGEESLKVKKVTAITSDEYQTAARRPLNSRMDSSKIKNDFKISLPDWSAGLKLVIDEII